jgi:hypothetical protein
MNVFSLFNRRPFSELEECLLRKLSRILGPSSDAFFRAQLDEIRRARVEPSLGNDKLIWGPSELIVSSPSRANFRCSRIESRQGRSQIRVRVRASKRTKTADSTAVQGEVGDDAEAG